MKRRTFYHLSLSLPYLALFVSVALAYMTGGLELFSASSSPGILGGLALFFTFSAVLWGPLYTWMVAVMLFWGRWRTESEVRTLYLLSPALLACAMGIPALLVGMPDSGMFMVWGFVFINHLDFVMPVFFENFSLEESLTVSLLWAFMAALCIVIGYAFVGCALLIERVMQRRRLFIEELPGNGSGANENEAHFV